LEKRPSSFFTEARQQWLLFLLTACTFFLLLGSRSLNEPDEGRYSEIAREMIETGDWLVPHFWYLPHLDKPPLTYWLVAASMKLFGQNEWAARLPAAFAGSSGVWAAFLLGCSLGGRRVGFWSAVILQSSLLYFVMARMLTTDIFVTQFVAWAVYFLWRSWLGLERRTSPRAETNRQDFQNRHDGGFAPPDDKGRKFWPWHLAGWAAIALGFLTKGPVALAIPIVALAALVILRWRTFPPKKLLFGGLLAGLLFFFVLAAPWFFAVFRRVPEAFHYMVFGQAAGHLLGTTIKNRRGGPFYFFGILAIGLWPWTLLLGWLWRRAHWRALMGRQKSAWVLLNVWAIFTFALFSLSHAKLPAYILPIFPAVAVLIAFRFFGDEHKNGAASAPVIVWRLCLINPLLLLAALPLALVFVFHDALPAWLSLQIPVAVGMAVLLLWLAKNLKPAQCAGLTVGLAVFSLVAIVADAPQFETTFRANQTLKPLGAALRENFQAGDAVVCWGRLPQGLPFYSGGAFSAVNRAYFGGMDLAQVPFEFPGNRERLGKWLLPDENALAKLLAENRRVWVVGLGTTMEKFQQGHRATPLRSLTRVGQWELLVNR
jgi:4-amino-4-deoxy-L-arabinose transferase-like glycosyltransferase